MFPMVPSVLSTSGGLDVTGFESAYLEEMCAACSTTRRRDRTTGEVLT